MRMHLFELSSKARHAGTRSLPLVVAALATLNAAQTLAQSTGESVRAARANEVARFVEREHFSRFAVIATTKGPFGETVDWVDPVDLDPDFHKRARPPELSKPALAKNLTNAAVPKAAEQVDLAALWNQPSVRGPAGTVPVLRPEYKHYVEGRSAAKSLEEFVASIPVPQPAGRDRLYNSRSHLATNVGTQGFVSFANIAQVPSDGMSLGQLGLFCNVGTSNYEGIEVGAQKNQPLYGDSNMHLFTFFRTNGKAQGDRVGGYNLNVAGFVQTGPFPPGATITMSPSGFSEMRIRATLFNNAWWVQHVAGSTFTWIGYYPIGTGANQIPFDQINNNACDVRWYGEVFDPTPTDWSNADMGNGVHGNTGGSAYFREMIVETAPNGGGGYWYPTNVPGTSTDAACYAMGALNSSTSPGWPVWFGYGGPGGDAAGCN